jgi:DNA-binding CsgD family transcriptional regulator
MLEGCVEMGELTGTGSYGYCGGRLRSRGEVRGDRRALVDLIAGLRRFDLSAFVGVLARSAGGVLGAAVERALCGRSCRHALQTEKRRADAAEERYALLHEANVVLSTVPHGPAALVAVARLAVPELADWCFVELLEDDSAPRGRIRRLVVAREEETGERLTRELTCRYTLDPSAPHGTPKVLRTGRPELIPEVRDEFLARDDEYLRWLRELAPGSYLCVPLQVGLRLVGSLGFVSSAVGSRVRHYGPHDLELAESIARCAALVVANIAEAPRRTSPSPAPDSGPGLTPRQLEVLQLLDSGMRVHQIKAELNLSEPTVRTHVRAILRAFGAGSQLEALHKARLLGLVDGAPGSDRPR